MVNDKVCVHHGAHRREVPAPELREAIISKIHSTLGHFGVARTYYMLKMAYFWPGMYKHVEDVVARCADYDRVKARFTAVDVVLHSLPICGLFYLMLELPLTAHGNRHCMIMVEHFSKWVEVAVMPTKSSTHTARAFLQSVLSRFGSCAEVLMDQGLEFRGEF